MESNKDRLENEFYSVTGFTHAGIKVFSGERFTGKSKKFSNTDLDYLEKRGRIVDFTSHKERRLNEKHINDQHENVKKLMENPFKDEKKEDLFANDLNVNNNKDDEMVIQQNEETNIEMESTVGNIDEMVISEEIQETTKKKFNKKSKK